jgi:putative CocE/NonD family hydrolase
VKRLLCLTFVVPLLSAAPAPATAGPRDAVVPRDYTSIERLSAPRFQTVREAHLVEMADGVGLYVEVVRPSVSGRWPIILVLSPYHGTFDDRSGTDLLPGPTQGGEPIGLAGYFAPRGYAVAFADLRGMGRSEGCLDLLGPDDASDSYALVEWLASREWSNGRVGMTGHSFPAMAAIMTAAQRPPHLVTIVPSAGMPDMYGHEYQQGVPYSDSFAGPTAGVSELRPPASLETRVDKMLDALERTLDLMDAYAAAVEAHNERELARLDEETGDEAGETFQREAEKLGLDACAAGKFLSSWRIGST